MSKMQFKTIEVGQFRQFSGTCLIEDLGPGLNIIAGSNEAGKSTLLTAIRAALFDRYKSSVGDSFRPYNAAVSPKVNLQFSVDEVEYTLEKVFSSKKDGGVRLTASNGHSWEGPEAEDYLSELLGFAYPGRGASKPEHQGLAGLLWIEQAKAYESVALQDDSRQRIQSVFEDEMRELLGGDKGDQLHQRIDTLRSEYFGAKDNPVGEYRRLIEQEEKLAKVLEQKQAELSEYETRIDHLDTLEQRLAGYEKDNTLANLSAMLSEAMQKQQELAGLQQALQVDEQKLSAAEAQFGRAEQSFKIRQELIAGIEKASTEVDRLTALVDSKEREIEPINHSLEDIRGQLEACKARRRDVAGSLRLARSYDKVEQLKAKIDFLESSISDAEQARASKREAERKYKAILVDRDTLKELRDLTAEVANRKARLEAVATKLDYDLQSGATVTFAGEDLSESGSIRITETADIVVGGVGTLVVTPGGDDLESLKAELGDLEDELGEKLADTEVASVASAESLLGQKDLLARDVSRYSDEYERAAPEGLEVLQDDLSERQAEITASLKEIGDLQQGEFTVEDLELQDTGLLDEADDLQEQINAKAGERESANNIVVEAKGNLAPEQERLADLQHQLDEARKKTSDEDLKAAVNSAQEAFDTLSTEVAETRQSVEEQNPEAVAADVERLNGAEQDLSREIGDLKRDIRDSKIELAALGHQGLSEEVATAADSHALVATQLAAMRKRADALDLLYRVLSEALSRAKQAVAQPVIDKILPYIRQLIPGAEPVVDEELGLVGISRDGTVEPFEQLSIGTREQLAVLLRLAYADLLSESGVPVTVMLDDALVNSDDGRRDSMKSILYQSARNYQVIVLTCHGREYADAGGKVFRLEDIALSSSAPVSGAIN